MTFAKNTLIRLDLRVQPGDWDWTAIAADATALAAIATAVTALLIWRQTVATNRTAAEAERSADTANEALAVAQRQQVYAAAQHQQSLFMAAEAMKARIDSSMPRITITNLEHSWPPQAAPLGESDPFPEESANAIKLLVTVSARLHNDGERAVEVAFGNGAILLIPGQSQRVTHTISRTLREWMEISDAIDRGEESMTDSLEFRYGSSNDQGGQDSQIVITSGSVVEPQQDSVGKRHLCDRLGHSLVRARRVYFISRADNERLPDIGWKDLPRHPGENQM